jgi:hypothetical protein
MDLRCLSCRLPLFACSGCRRQGKGGVATGQVADSGELPARDDERGVLLLRWWQFSCVFGSLALAVSAAFPADGTEGGGVAAAFRSEVATTPHRR